MEQVIFTVSVVNEHDKIRNILSGFRAITIWHFQAEIVVLDASPDFRMLFGDAAELSLPVAMQDYSIDMEAIRTGLPAERIAGIEADMACRTRWIVGIEQSMDWAFSFISKRDCLGNSLASHIR